MYWLADITGQCIGWPILAIIDTLLADIAELIIHLLFTNKNTNMGY